MHLVDERSGKQTALMLAASTGRAGFVNFLLEGARDRSTLLNQQDAHGRTALILAAENGQALTVRALLQVAADRYLVNAERMTAIMAAFSKGEQAHDAVLFEFHHVIGTTTALGPSVSSQDGPPPSSLP